MRILIIYTLEQLKSRNTISEHLYSFEKYAPGCEINYLNVIRQIPSYVKNILYDMIILHYTYLAGNRFTDDPTGWNRKTAGLSQLQGIKVAIPQDEYDHTGRLCRLFDEADVKVICTCYDNEKDIDSAYRSGMEKRPDFLYVFTGYVDENSRKHNVQFLQPFAERKIDIGYRARKLPAYFGRHGQLKYQLVEFFKEKLRNTDFVYDINNSNSILTSEDKNLVKLGNSWYDFLLNCKTFIGCEGGSSLLDSDGSIKKKVIAYTSSHPLANFDEIEAACFPGKDFNISCFAISPRHFEAAATKTLQILVEGNYGGIFKPWRHYLPLKKDFSNVDEILEKLKDAPFCQKIIDTAYDEIVVSDRYTYKNFVDQVLDHTNDRFLNVKRDRKSTSLLKKYLEARNFLLVYYNFTKRTIIQIVFGAIARITQKK